ncbi:hypothetical protein IU449_27525 [Nocardia higoensis]|uniref:Uncharacterized protein n=1 Tax=Nocardia higoensis TaxID=228599 RepID=A0ABS0DIG1_9NOCA|nr:hypothetical protein [Nocardia higoensis]MBF6358252.1 hypothetical protein [Nocardia higoensis]
MLAAAPPDQLVEMLPPLLWLHYSTGAQANLCVSAAMTLRSTYALLGIEARPTPVDLVIGHRAGGLLARYGGEHRWEGQNYHGHCVLWLPGSGRWIDTTVMQYPEVRASMPLPVVGRSAGTFGGNAAARTALAQGRLIAGTHMTVPREELILDYTVVADEDDTFLHGIHALAEDTERRFRDSGANLAAACLEWWRKPGIVERVRTAPYPQLHALLDAIGGAPIHVDADETWLFEIAPGRHVRLDELLPAS